MAGHSARETVTERDKDMGNVNKLKNIVPPVELCKQIPEGEFEDSALVWVYDMDGLEMVMPREVVQFEGTKMIAAPTLEEILNALYKQDRYENKLKICPVFPGGEWSIGYSYQKVEKDFDLTAAALRLWFEVKGIEVK